MTDWSDFADRLTQQVAVLPENAVVTIGSVGWSVPYVQAQLVRPGGSVWATFQGEPLSGALASFGTDPELMSEVGWQSPGNSDHGTCWWIELPWPVSVMIHRQLASMIVTGFRDVHRIASTSALAYSAWDLEASERNIELPLLGLPLRDLP
ncbi:TY-Chap domain-containing protein [Nocardia sp. NBC_01327]|uniref:TY-Chap domain-containing protein n=1 Tax=Nocardia sp. NBC_01327 TaxID=2903593 RepID=UPI002E0D3C86|nr:hypothetical protein OG326_30775 [Nocardia sp. NBC_01327]